MERKRSVKKYGSRRLKKPIGEKCKDFWRNFIAFMFSNVGIIGLVVGYTVAGAFLFQAIEGPLKEESTQVVEIARNATTEKLWHLLAEGMVYDEPGWLKQAGEELKNYTDIITEAIRNGYDGPKKNPNSSKWSFSGAFLYSLTVITTIGYGNVAPKTHWGKVTTIVYAIIGMPLFLLYLSNIGDILARCFKWLYAKCCLCRWCPNVARRREERRRYRESEVLGGPTPPGTLRQTESIRTGVSTAGWQRQHAVSIPMDHINTQQYPATSSEEGGEEEDEDSDAHGSYDEEYDTETVTVPVTICLAIMVGYVCGGAVLFSKYEEWNYLDGSYFCFISLSTIGFGDIVPGSSTYYTDEQGIAMSFVFCSMYLMLGMALIAMCFNLMQEEVIHKMRSIIRTIRRIFR